MSRSTGGRWAAAFFAFALIAGACSSGVDVVSDDDAAGDVDSETETSAPDTADEAEVVVPTAPLTGEVVAEGDAVLADPSFVVKIGNNDQKSRPQAGLNDADVVYEELVEARKTRFAAVFQSSVPETVYPVRSGRSTDIDLMVDFKRPLFVNSGGNPSVVGLIVAAAKDDRIVDAREDAVPDAFGRLSSRARPNNLQVFFDDLPTDEALAPPPLFMYRSEGEATEGVEVGGVVVEYESTGASSGRSAEHIWDQAVGGWVRVQDETLHQTLTGTDERLVEIAPQNVVVVSVDYKVSDFDTESPEALTYGEGKAKVFTDGHEIDGTWTRNWGEVGWQLTTTTGEPIKLTPGRTWVLLANRALPVYGTAVITTMTPAEGSARLAEVREIAAQDE